MPQFVSDASRRHLARSLPLLQRHRDALAAAFEASLRSAEQREEPFGQSELTASLLVDLLIAQGRGLAGSGELAGLAELRREHRAAGIVGRHYSRFGDVLVPVLGDVLGPGLPREIGAAWCDAFWAIIRAMQPEPQRARA